MNFGTEVHHINVSNRYNEFEMKMTDNYSAVFVESETYVSKNLALRIGARGEYTSVLDRYNVSPRISMAYKTGESRRSRWPEVVFTRILRKSICI